MNIKKIKKAQNKILPIQPTKPVMPPKQVTREYEDVTGLTNAEIERNDLVHNEIHELINRLTPKGELVEWDMEVIGEVSDAIEDYFVAKGICTAMEFSPYREV